VCARTLGMATQPDASVINPSGPLAARSGVVSCNTRYYRAVPRYTNPDELSALPSQKGPLSL
jgi:hypothetical protein